MVETPPPADGAAERHGRAAIALVGCCLIAGFTVWQVALAAQAPFPARYDYDEGVYAATADAFARGDRLYTDVFLSQPPFLIVVLGGLFHLLGPSLAAARAAIVGFAALWLLALLTILSARGHARGGTLVVGLLLGCWVVAVQARTVEMELPSEALACTALALVGLGTRRPGIGWWAAAGGVAVLAASTKLTAIAYAIPLFAAEAGRRGAAPGRQWGGAAGALLVLAALFPIIGAAGFWDQVFTFHLVLAGTVPRAPMAHAMLVARFLAGVWPLSAAAALGIWWLVRSGGRLERALVVWLAAECAGLIALAPLWEHDLVILLSPLALLAGIALDRIATRVVAWVAARTPPLGLGLKAVAVAATIAYLVGGVFTAMPTARPSAELQRVAARLTAVVPPDGEVLTDDPMLAFLAHRRAAARLIDTSLTRIWTGGVSEARLTAALRQETTRAVAFWRGTFRRSFPRLEPTAAGLFPFAVRAEEGRVVLWR